MKNVKNAACLTVTAGLCASMVLIGAPTAALADDLALATDQAARVVTSEQPAEEPATEVEVSTQAELRAAIDDNAVTKITLTSDIVMNGEWVSAEIAAGRTLLIEGNGHAIINMVAPYGVLKPNGSGIPGDGGSCDYYCGFIGNNKGTTTVQNLTFDSAEVDIKKLDAAAKSTGSSCLGVVAGNNSAGTLVLNNVSVENSVVRGYGKAGGFVGFNQNGGTTTINKCAIRNTEIVCEADGTDPEAGFSGVVVGYDGNKAVTTNGVLIEGCKTTIDDSVNWNTEILTDEYGTRYVEAYGSKYGITCETYTNDGLGIATRPMPAAVNGYRYESVAEAIAAAKDGDTVTLVVDIAEDIVIPEGKSIVLDLAGHTLSNKTRNAVTNNGTLTIKDTVGAGAIDAVTPAGIAFVNNGTAIIEGGKLTRSKEAGTPGAQGANTNYTVNNMGELTIKGGEVINTSERSSLIRNAQGCTLNIEGGRLSNVFNTIKNEETGILKISGGVVDSKDQAVQNWGSADISGGEFNGSVMAWGWDDFESSLTIGGDAVINGNVVAVKYKNYESSPSVVINGGMVNGKVFKATSDGSAPAEKVDSSHEGSEIVINDGTFSDPSISDFISPDAGLQQDENGNYKPVEVALVLDEGVIEGVYALDIKGGTIEPLTEQDLLGLVSVNVIGYTVSVDTTNLAGLNKAIETGDTSDSFNFVYTATKDEVKEEAAAARAGALTTTVTVKLTDSGDPNVKPDPKPEPKPEPDPKPEPEDKPESKPEPNEGDTAKGDTLPGTGDASMVAVAVSGLAGMTALAAATRRRKAE